MASQKIWQMFSVASVFAVMAGPVVSQSVTIQSVDGNVSIQGDIVGFDGQTYELDSLIGRMSIPAASVICLGDACPEVDDGRSLTGRIGVLDQTSMALLNGLIGAFAADRELALDQQNDGAAVTTITFTDTAEEDAGTLTLVEADARTAFLELVNGDSKFVVSTAPISEDLAVSLVNEGYPDLRAPGREVIIALDAVAPVVHPSNTVRDLSLPVLARIAAGRITNWSELGGPDAEIRMILSGQGTPIYDLVDQRIMRPNRLRLDRDLELAASEGAAADLVRSDPFAITLTSNALLQATKPLPIRQVCGPLSVPTNFSVKAEEYALARRVVIYTSGADLPEAVKDLIAYAGSAAAQTQYQSAGFVGQTVETVPMSLQGSRLASAILYADTPEIFTATRNLTEKLTRADRLSTTFRFEPGSTELDNKSRRDAVRIAQHLMLPENANREILLLGFTDSVGRDDLNQLLSLQQAVSISEAIVAASSGQISDDRIRVTSYGSVAPVGCNDTVEGRNSNRRVEVWLR